MIPVSAPWFDEEEVRLVTEAVRSGWAGSSGPFVGQFENGFASYCGARHGVAVANGTVALHLALTALGVKAGDEVIVPALTFIATANTVVYNGARPVFVDVSPTDWGMDPKQVEAAITPRTKAIIAVHLYGHPCDLDALNAIAARHGIPVIEDAAEAHGAEIRGRRVGSMSAVSCFSFYGNKIITTGEGGICVTNDAELDARMRILRGHGMSPERKYWHEVVGFNYRMTNLQAAMGVAQLAKLDRAIERKRRIAGWYAERLEPLARKGVLQLHPEADWAKCVYWMYSVRVAEEHGGAERLIAGLAQHEIETRPFFVPVHQLPPHRRDERFPVAESLHRQGVNLPSGVTLDETTVAHVAERILEVLT